MMCRIVLILLIVTAFVKASIIPEPLPQNPPETTVLQGPSIKTRITGPDGSVIMSETPGGEIVHDAIPGAIMFITHWSPDDRLSTKNVKVRQTTNPLMLDSQDPLNGIIAHSNGLLASGQSLIPNPVQQAENLRGYVPFSGSKQPNPDNIDNEGRVVVS